MSRPHEKTRRLFLRTALATVLGAVIVAVGSGCSETRDSVIRTPGSVPTPESVLQNFPTQPPTTTEDTGLQPTDTFGRIPQHEETLTSIPILPQQGPGLDQDPFDHPGPPLPGGPQLPAAATVAPTLTTPAG